MNFNQQLQEAYEAGYYRALNEQIGGGKGLAIPAFPAGQMPGVLPSYDQWKRDGGSDEDWNKLVDGWKRAMDGYVTTPGTYWA